MCSQPPAHHLGRALRIAVVAVEEARAADEDLPHRADRRSSSVSGSAIRTSMPPKGRPPVSVRSLLRVVEVRERDHAAALREAVGGQHDGLRNPRPDLAQRRGRRRVEQRAHLAEVGALVVGVAQDALRDRRKAGVREGAPLHLHLPQGRPRLEVGHAHERAAGTEVREEQQKPGHVEEWQRVPELLVLREPEPIHDPRGRADEALVCDQAALRVRRRAGRVHEERHVPDTDSAPAQLELLEGHSLTTGEEGGAIEVAGG